jgi:hypothetical protein
MIVLTALPLLIDSHLSFVICHSYSLLVNYGSLSFTCTGTITKLLHHSETSTEAKPLTLTPTLVSIQKCQISVQDKAAPEKYASHFTGQAQGFLPQA